MACGGPSKEFAVIKSEEAFIEIMRILQAKYQVQRPDSLLGTAIEEKWQKKRDFPVAMDNLKLHPKLHYWCEQPFDAMVINWNGEVFPCCTACDDRLSLGNLLTTDIKKLWNNQQYRACRKFLYNYGPLSRTGSVCEKVPCELKSKHL